jgi:hypothetical protein
MSRIAIAFAMVASGCLIGVAFLAGQPVAVGADGVVTAPTVSWVSLLMSLFTGSTVASIAAFWRQWQPTIKSVRDTIAPGIPIPPAEIEQQLQAATELLQAVVAFSKNGDAAAQRRMVVALMTELAMISETQSPEIAAAVGALMQAITAKWFPAVTEVTK